MMGTTAVEWKDWNPFQTHERACRTCKHQTTVLASSADRDRRTGYCALKKRAVGDDGLCLDYGRREA